MLTFSCKRVICALAICLSGVLSENARAQATNGSIQGAVMDTSGKVVPGASVTVVQEGTRDSRTATTDESGDFIFPSLQPGPYTVRVQAAGFQRYEKTGINLTASERLSLGTVSLTVGSVSETITVTAEGSAVQTASSESSAVLTTRQLDMIAQKGRVLSNYLLLLPGVATNAGTQDAPSGFLTLPHASGLPNTMMTFQIDGLQGQDMGSTQLFTTSISPDAVGEVKVLLNNYQAEYGRNGGATVQVVTRSGTKDFHGTVYWYKRHEMFNANNFFNNRSNIPKAPYRYNTRGASIGGPIMIPKLFNTEREKLFFFYNFDDNPSTQPSALGQTTLPTAAERMGDFSQSLNASGNLIPVIDPLTGVQFPGNIIPQNRINRQGQILLNVFPLPNQLNRTITKGAFNNEFQIGVPNKRPGHVFRIDYRPTDADSLYFRGTWTKFQSVGGSLSNFDFARNSFSALNKNAVLSWTRVVTPRMVNELSAGVRRPQEITTIDDDRAFRTTYGFTAGQFNPEINYPGLLPQVSFSGAGLQNLPNFSNFQAGRFPQIEADILYYLQDGFTITRNKHTFKFGFYAEKDRISTGSGLSAIPMGSFVFGVDQFNPNDARHPFANALLGNFQTYTESTVRTRPAGVATNIDWYVQDSWRIRPNLTLELGLRSVYYTPWNGWHGTSTSFALERYNAAKAPVLMQPTLVNNVRMAVNPLTGQTHPAALIGSFVPGTGDPGNGTLTSADPTYPVGFFETIPQLWQPRLGFSWDVFGNGKTAVRGGFGTQHQLLRYEPASAGAPISYNPVFYYGNLDTFLNASGTLSPGNVTGHQKDRPTPTVHNIHLGVQQDIGFATVLEAKYVSTLGRHLATTRAINTIPYGARFLDQNPQNRDPGVANPTPLPENFLRPYPGWANITNREAGGSSNYHALQMQANRRFASGLQFGVAYTYSKTMDYGGSMPIYNNARVWNYALSDFDQTHMLTMNYTYSLPKIPTGMSNVLTRGLFNYWEVSGIATFASGTPTGVTLQLSDNADLTGGGDGQRVNVIADPRISHGERGFEKMFNTQAFARPARGTPGNAPRNFLRNPGTENFDVTLFKNFPLMSEQRLLQLRWEVYNVFNHTQFDQMNTTATFNAAGAQTNTQFGQATRARPPRVMQVSLRLRF